MAKNATSERQNPNARVLAYIKDPVFGNNRRFVEILGFTQINTTLSNSGQGTATIIFPNFKSSLMRYISDDAIKEFNNLYTGLSNTNDKAKDFMTTLSKKGRSNFFHDIWNDLVINKSEFDPISYDKGNFKDYNRSGGSLSEDTRNVSSVIREGIVYALPFLDLFDPIFVDYKGQDGFWYAGFTGVVSRVGDNCTKTGDQSLTIGCRDLSALLDNVSLVSGWNRFSSQEAASPLREFVYSTEANLQSAKNAAFQNIFGAEKFKSVVDIILEIVRTAQELWTLEKFGDTVGVEAFRFDTSKVYTYNGISSRRGSTQYAGGDFDIDSFQYIDSVENMNPENFIKPYGLETRSYMYDKSSTKSDRGQKKIFVDPLIREFDNIFIHKLLSKGLSLYKDSLKSADEIISDIVAKMFAYKYFDANGNMIIELPKYNAFPNLEKYGGRSTATAIRHRQPPKNDKTPPRNITAFVSGPPIPTLYGFANNNGVRKTSVEELKKLNNYPNNTAVFKPVTRNGRNTYHLIPGAEVIVGKETINSSIDPLKDFKNATVEPKEVINLDSLSDGPDYVWNTVLFHGKNYILTHDDFISFNTSIDEAPLVTITATDAVFPYLEKSSDNLLFSTAAMHGVSVADFDTLAKLGVRRYQTQNIYNVRWPNNVVGARVLSYQSAAVRERVNSQADSGTIQLNHRPELQVGRTFINPLRMKSYMIMGITNSWSQGSIHSTTLNLSYGHPMHKTLEMPWTAIFAEPSAFGFENGIASFNTINPVNSQGEIKSNDILEEASPNV